MQMRIKHVSSFNRQLNKMGAFRAVKSLQRDLFFMFSKLGFLHPTEVSLLIGSPGKRAIHLRVPPVYLNPLDRQGVITAG